MINFIKKIVLLLAIIIIPLNSCFAVSADSLKERILINSNGDAEIFVNISIDSAKVFTVKLPWNFSQKVKKITTAPGFSANMISRQGNKYLLVKSIDSTLFSHIYAKVEVEKFYDFENEKIKDYGNYSISYRFMNTTLDKIKFYQVEIVLPEGFNITSVDESFPELTESNPDVPYFISREKNLNKVVLHSSKLKMGTNAFINFRLKEEHKTYTLLIMLLLVAGLYLVFFRDVIKIKENSK